MKKLVLSIILGSLILAGCTTNPKIMLPGYHNYNIVYVNCLGSVFTHKGILLADNDKDGIVLRVGNKLEKFNRHFCSITKTNKHIVTKGI